MDEQTAEEYISAFRIRRWEDVPGLLTFFGALCVFLAALYPVVFALTGPLSVSAVVAGLALLVAGLASLVASRKIDRFVDRRAEEHLERFGRSHHLATVQSLREKR